MSIDGYRIIAPVAYQGKPDCDDVRCTHLFLDGVMQPGCRGYHCAYCDQPCSSQGHRCPASEALIEAATRIAREEEKT